MSRLKAVAACILVVLAAGNCAPDPTPAVDLAAEEAAIRAVDRTFMEAAQAGDAAAFAAVFAPDGQLLFPNEPAVTGREAIRAHAEEMLALPGFSVTWEASRYIIAESGDVAASIGTYDLVMTLPDGPVEDHGKYLTLWQKVDGEWRVAADMTNTSLPLPSPDGR